MGRCHPFEDQLKHVDKSHDQDALYADVVPVLADGSDETEQNV